ncbi:MAG: DHH family phosphoesterase [archaeon]
MLKVIDIIASEFLKVTEKKPIRIISHYDTDGITSASILAKTCQRLDKKFTVRIVKSLTEELISQELKRQPKEVIVFSDLASGSLESFKNLEEPIFILDHHEIHKESLNDKIKIINPHLTEKPEDNDCTGAGICYLFSKAISQKNKDLSSMAIIGMIGDRHESNLSKSTKQ